MLFRSHLQQQSPVPPFTHGSSFIAAPSRASVLPAVSYASEAEVDWDLVDVVKAEEADSAQPVAPRKRI